MLEMEIRSVSVLSRDEGERKDHFLLFGRVRLDCKVEHAQVAIYANVFIQVVL